MRTGLALAACLALAGCYGGSQDSLRKYIKAPEKSAAAQMDVSVLTPEALANSRTALLLVLLEKSKASASLVIAANSGPYQTWRGADGTTLTFRGGVLTESRGLPQDLLVADGENTAAALAGRRGQSYERRFRYIGPDRETVTRRYTCSMAVTGGDSVTILNRKIATTKMAETCTGEAGGALNNLYWLGSDGLVWQSRQYVSEKVGYMATQRLVR